MKEHHFDNTGKLPEYVKGSKSAKRRGKKHMGNNAQHYKG